MNFDIFLFSLYKFAIKAYKNQPADSTNFRALVDIQQYIRLGTVEFGNIKKNNRGNTYNPEDCNEAIKHLCDKYLDITMERYDISIAHHQFNPTKKRKYGKPYTFLPFTSNW